MEALENKILDELKMLDAEAVKMPELSEEMLHLAYKLAKTYCYLRKIREYEAGNKKGDSLI